MADGALFLFDIDGTLLKGGTQVHREAFRHAYREVYGIDMSLDGVSAAGRTDTWLLAEPLRQAGMPDDRIWELMPDAFTAMQDYVEEHLGDLREYVLPGVPEVLAALYETDALLGLLTGNLSRIAFAKMEHAGLGRYFERGGFGEESEVRAHLVPVAMAHASVDAGHPMAPDRVVVIGDTPMDIEAGRAHGTRTVGVATGPYSDADLREAGADAVLLSFADPRASVETLEALTRPRG